MREGSPSRAYASIVVRAFILVVGLSATVVTMMATTTMMLVRAQTLSVTLPSILNNNVVPALGLGNLGTVPQTHELDWKIQYANVTRLCHTKSMVTVNGQFPGPTLMVGEGDRVRVKVTNLVDYNITIHWHGVRQLLTAWADGPAYITQCPIQKGSSYVYDFQIIGQRGTLFWHAHISWLRATVYGAFIIAQSSSLPNPFGSLFLPRPLKTPDQEFHILIGEWWNANVEDIAADSVLAGGIYNLSNAFTINGQPGALYNCSIDDTPIYEVKKGGTYRLRIINAAMNFQVYFGVANHSLTVVEADAEYTEPMVTDFVVLAPGQSTSAQLEANQAPGRYFMAVSVFSPAPRIPYPPTPATALLQYNGFAETTIDTSLALPSFPSPTDTAYVANFTHSLKGRPSSQGFYYYNIPNQTDVDLFFTVGYARQICDPATCPYSFVPNTTLVGAINNITFQLPHTHSLLEAFYYNISGVYETDFPDKPNPQYDYTGVNPTNKISNVGTKVKVLEYNQTVQVVLQDTATVFFESHPIHLHGQNFFVVGSGVGNFNPDTDPNNFNLINPPSRNTIAIPYGGWVAIRFQAVNPGVWFMHCHFELHTSGGMTMAFVVKNGPGPNETLGPPPSDFPRC